MATNNQVEISLRKINSIFSIRDLRETEVNKNLIEKYYARCSPAYRLLHSSEGSVHMALNFDGKFQKSGYLGQVLITSEYIRSIKPKNVLELGSGKGYNSIYLARKNPKINFFGIDLSGSHLRVAKRNGNKQKNLKFSKDNFQKLSFSKNKFELIFEVESVCHALDMKEALSNVFRVLKPGGTFILFDGFRKPGFKGLDKNLKIAAELVEKSMAVESFWLLEDWKGLAREVGFEVVETKDLSPAILPNLLRLQRISDKYFNKPLLARSIALLFPSLLVRNSIAGLLMPVTVQGNAHGYYQIVLKKPKK